MQDVFLQQIKKQAIGLAVAHLLPFAQQEAVRAIPYLETDFVAQIHILRKFIMIHILGPMIDDDLQQAACQLHLRTDAVAVCEVRKLPPVIDHAVDFELQKYKDFNGIIVVHDIADKRLPLGDFSAMDQMLECTPILRGHIVPAPPVVLFDILLNSRFLYRFGTGCCTQCRHFALPLCFQRKQSLRFLLLRFIPPLPFGRIDISRS